MKTNLQNLSLKIYTSTKQFPDINLISVWLCIQILFVYFLQEFPPTEDPDEVNTRGKQSTSFVQTVGLQLLHKMGMFHMNLCSVPKHFKTKHIIIHVQVVLTFIMKPLLLCTHISRASVLLMNISHIQYTDHKKGGRVFKYLSNFSIVSILNSKHHYFNFSL